MLERYWFRFWKSDELNLPPELGHGCGVTARNFDDALELLKTRVFRHGPVPVIESIITTVDISTLDADLVLSQMWAPVWRGVRFPLGYQDNMTPEEEQEITEEKEKEGLS